jgi:hypothetical protein
MLTTAFEGVKSGSEVQQDLKIAIAKRSCVWDIEVKDIKKNQNRLIRNL